MRGSGDVISDAHISMKALQTLLLVAGFLCVFAGITGIQRLGWNSGYGWAIAYYHGWQRVLPIAAAFVLFTWWVTIRQRHISGWYIGCGFYFLAIAQLLIFQGLLPLLSAPAAFDGWWAFISQAVCAALVFFAFKKLWLPKKQQWFQAK
jgi:hypothetical protein